MFPEIAFLVIVTLAVAAFITTPMVAVLGPGELNGWVTRLPFVYVPTVLVAAAIAGHIAVFRKLTHERQAPLGAGLGVA